MSNWISVKVGLPDKAGEYLVTYHPRHSTDLKVGLDSFRGQTCWAKYHYREVVVWQPKPEPYKPEDLT